MSDFTAERKYFAGRRKGSAPLPFNRINVRAMPRDGAIIFGDMIGELDALQVAHTRRGCESAKLIDARLCVLPSRSRGWRLRGTQARTSAQQSDLDVEKLFMTLGNVGGFDHHPGNFEPDISRQVKIVRIGRIHAYPV